MRQKRQECEEEALETIIIDRLRSKCEEMYRICDRLQMQQGAFEGQKLMFRECTRLEIVLYLIYIACYEHRILNSEVRFIHQVTGMYISKEQSLKQTNLSRRSQGIETKTTSW